MLSNSGWPGTCSNKGKVEVDGEWLCGVHSPEADARRATRIETKWEARKSAYVRNQRLSAAREGVVKALEGFCDWIESRPAGIHPDAEPVYHDAGAALKELEEASK
ncbi:hypothetical protein LCGC14_1381960 [marine sediment metagenome]|uniref:Uncharacterized protein n=1 Tax=marine sediment metagenome TaxID=412755 RepID=A0A0F9N414_9ZZZZ